MVVVDDDLVGAEIGQKLRAESVVEQRARHTTAAATDMSVIERAWGMVTFLHSVSFAMNFVQAVRVATGVSV